MLRILALLLGINFSCGILLYGQVTPPATFTGVVMDADGVPLSGAWVIVRASGKSDVTDASGVFSIDDELPEPTFEVEISSLGYETLKKTISPIKGEKHKFYLDKSAIQLEEVVVKESYAEYRKKESSLSVEVVDDEYLKQNLGGSLMKSLERLPGVTTIDIGSGQSKPVIRGLGFNRVVVVENNIKHEAQQWGADHGLEIDQYSAEEVEVVKGPASLMYGSDAIGGVIDIRNRRLPKENTFSGKVDVSAKSNNDFLGTSVLLSARKKHFFATARATLLGYGDFRVPTDSVDIYNYRVPLHKNQLRNTAGYERNWHTSFGVVKRHFQSRFYLSNISSKSGFFANAHGLEPRNVDHTFHDASNRDIQYPFQKVNHFKLINRSTYWMGKWRVELDLGYQRNHREEWSQYVQHGHMPAVFPDSLDFNPEIERQFQKDIFSGNARFSKELSHKTRLDVGLNTEHKQNQIGGRGFIIPAYRQTSLGSFAIMKHRFSEKSLLQAGIRYDYGHINTQRHHDWFSSPTDGADGEKAPLERAADINRNFSNFTWSLGYSHNTSNWAYQFNMGKSFRMPIAKELAANGVNYHRFSYEVGNADLSPEVSYQFDVGISYHSKRLDIGVTPFLNYFTNYIYLNPTAAFDRLYGFGNQVFEYTESRVLRYGGELHARYNITESLQVGIMGEYVYAEQLSGEKKGFTLPFAPPASGIININYKKPKIGFVNNAYLSLDYRLTAAQNDIVPPEETTDGFQVVNLGLGGDLKWRKQPISVALQVQNVLNNRYFNHTSYYRLINVPEPSRNFIINISIPFSYTISSQL